MSRVLVLNANYQPLGSIDWMKAVTLLFSNKVEVVEEYEDKEIRSTRLTIKMPAVVRLLKWVKGKNVGLRFNKTNVYVRDKGRCQYCNSKISIAKSTYDHIKPKSRGGSTDWSNIVTACYKCNQKKDCRTPEEAGMTLVSLPRKPESLPLEMSFNLRYKDHLPKEWKNWLITINVTE